MSNRLGLSPEQADRYLVTWAEGDITASLKQALNVRKFRLKLDYTTHTPMLFIVKPNGDKVLWRILDTRKFRNAVALMPANEIDAQALADHVGESLEKLGFRLIIGHRKDPQTKRQEAMLLVTSDDSRHWVLSMIAVPKGSAKTIDGGK